MSETLRYGRVVSHADGSRELIDLFAEESRYPLAAFESPVQAGSIVRYRVVDAEAQVDSVFAEAGSARAVIWLALGEHRIDPQFPDAVQREVEAIVESPGIDDPALVDLLHLPFITIDNEDSRDLDQAMHIAEADGSFVLHYALADAAYYVPPGSALFAESLQRGASYYTPGFAVPMLPRALSEGLVSLNEGVVRRALVFEIRFDDSGSVAQTTVRQARIKSAAKLSYNGVEAYYRDPAASALKAQDYTGTLDSLKLLGLLLIEQARNRNVVEYNRRTVEISLSDDGTHFTMTDSVRLDVERYNEQISLICNSEGARLLEQAGLPSVVQAIYRVHGAPDEERLKKFSRLIRGMIKHYKLPPEIWIWRWRDGRFGKREHLSAYLQRLKDAKVDTGLYAALQRNALMLSPASVFSAEAGQHYSLKLDQYARFSSPMREVAGIYTHNEYLQYQALSNADPGVDLASVSEADLALQSQVIDAANRARQIQKKLNKVVMKKAIDQLFEGQLSLPEVDRQHWYGVVTSLRKTRIYVQLDSPLIAVKVYLKELSQLSGLSYSLDSSSAFVAASDGAEYALGQRIALKVVGYSADNLRWGLAPV